MLERVMKKLRGVSAIFLAGAVIGGVLVHKYEFLPFKEMVKRGFCGQEDPQPSPVLFFYPCRDAYIAARLQARDLADALAEDENLAEMGKAQVAYGKRGKK